MTRIETVTPAALKPLSSRLTGTTALCLAIGTFATMLVTTTAGTANAACTASPNDYLTQLFTEDQS